MTTLRLFIYYMCLVLTVFSCRQGQTQSVNPVNFLAVLDNAEEAAQGSRWAEAEKLWEQVVKSNPLVGKFWYDYACASYANGNYDQAILNFKKTNEYGGYPPAVCLLQLAKCFARKGDQHQAFNYISLSRNAGLRNMSDAVNDEAFKNYINNPDFRSLIGLPEKELTNRIEGWRFDLKFLQGEIKRKAVKPYRFEMERIDSMVQVIFDAIPTMTDFQITVAFMKLMVMVNDGHTLLYPFSDKQPEFFQNLPLDFYFFDEGLYIVAAEKQYSHLIGSRVLKLDGKSPQEVLTRLDPIIFRDQNWSAPLVGGTIFIRLVPLLHELGISEKPDEITLKLINPAGKSEDVKIKATSEVSSRKLWDGLPAGWENYYQKSGVAPPLYLKDPYNEYWFEYLDQEKTVYFQYNRVASKQAEPFENFTDHLFNFINAHDVDKLVIDIRLNNGGNSERLINFINKLTACTKIFQKGKLFTIIGRRTYSAAQNCATLIEKWTPSVFVGEPTGSSPNFVGEEAPFELPYSKLLANVSDWYHQTSGPNDYRTWLAPLIYTPPTFKDYSTGKDGALEAVLSMKQ